MNNSMTKRVSAFLLAMCVAVSAAAADLSGTWTGTLKDPGGGAHEITLKIPVAGSRVTGSFAGGPPMGQEQPITNGRLTDHKLSFEIDTPTPDGQTMVLHYHGTISGTTIHGTADTPMGSLPWTATKG